MGACVNVSIAEICRGNLTLNGPPAGKPPARVSRETARPGLRSARAAPAATPHRHTRDAPASDAHTVIMMIGSCTSQIQVPQRAAAGSARGTLEHTRWALQPKFKVRTLSHSPAKATPNDANARRRQTPAATSCRHNHHRAGATRAQPARFDQLPDCHLFSEVVAHARLA